MVIVIYWLLKVLDVFNVTPDYDLSIMKDGYYLNIPLEYIIDDDDLVRSYLRGLFLVAGSINDPKTSRYHLEFLVDTKEYAEFINNLLNDNELNSKIINVVILFFLPI